MGMKQLLIQLSPVAVPGYVIVPGCGVLLCTCTLPIRTQHDLDRISGRGHTVYRENSMSANALDCTRKWVSYLCQLGPSSSNNNLFDEKLVINIKKLGISPIEIESPFDKPLLATVQKLANEGTSAVVLLAGMAGDGKTRTARKLWEALSNGNECLACKWNNDRFPTIVLESQNGSRYQIVFVKDLSHNLDTDPTGDDNPMSVTEVPDATCHVIACNHGKLLDFIRTTDASEKAAKLADALEKDFFAKKTQDKIDVLGHTKVYLFDLSVYNPAEKFESIMKEACRREEWKGCAECPCSTGCHIAANRRALWNEETQKLKTPALRQTELIRLVGCNGVHLPFRDLLVLAVNDLLGTHELGKPRLRKRLLTCDAVEKAHNLGSSIESYVYCNLLGENLPNSVQQDNLAIRELARFGLGTHAPRLFDRMLTTPEMSASIRRLVEPSASASLWDVTPQSETNFARELLKMRRQAMFFCIPDCGEIDRWQLTAFSFGKDYLPLLCLPAEKPKSAQSDLVEGMNRVFTGQFRMEKSELFITTAGTKSGSLQGELLRCNFEVRPRLRRHGGKSGIFVGTDETGGVSLQFFDSDQCVVQTPLSPPLYEFFRRQAEGYAISGFTRECRAQAFQLKSLLIKEFAPIETDDDYYKEMTIDLLPMTNRTAVKIILKTDNVQDQQ